MICNNCGQTVPDGIKSCPHCGTTYIYTSEPVNAAPFNSAAENPVVKKFNAIFSDKLFLAAGVLIAVKTGISFLLGSVDVISLLFAIFLLITYFKAKNGALTSDHLRYTSGCVFAKVILKAVKKEYESGEHIVVRKQNVDDLLINYDPNSSREDKLAIVRAAMREFASKVAYEAILNGTPKNTSALL